MLGPYEERDRWRLIIVEDGGRRSVFLPTREEALKFKAGTQREITPPASRRIADVIAHWHTDKLRERPRRWGSLPVDRRGQDSQCATALGGT